MSRRALALLLALSLTTPATLVRAEPTATEQAAARKKFDRALELEKASDFKGALALLREVAAVHSNSQVRFHVALCLEKTGKLVEAREEYLRAKEDAEVKEGPESLELAKKCGAAAADLDERIPRVEVRVPEDIVSAKLSVDGGPPVSIIVNPVVRVDPGEHKLQVTSPGRRTFKQTARLKERDATLVLSPELPVSEGDEPPEPEAAPSTTATSTTAALPRRDEGQRASSLPWVVGGLGLAALATSGVFFALRDSAIHDLDQACGPDRNRCPSSSRDVEDRGRLYTTTANVFLGVGAAAVVTGVVLYAAQPKTRSPAMTASVSPAPGGLSLALTGSF